MIDACLKNIELYLRDKTLVSPYYRMKVHDVALLPMCEVFKVLCLGICRDKGSFARKYPAVSRNLLEWKKTESYCRHVSSVSCFPSEARIHRHMFEWACGPVRALTLQREFVSAYKAGTACSAGGENALIAAFSKKQEQQLRALADPKNSTQLLLLLRMQRHQLRDYRMRLHWRIL